MTRNANERTTPNANECPLKKYSGHFYTYRGNGYGPFETLDEAKKASVKKKLEKEGILGRSYDAVFHIGTIEVDKNKRLRKANLIMDI